MRFTAALNSVKKFQDEMLKFRRPKQASISDFLVWLFKDRDYTLKGFKNTLIKQKLHSIKQVNMFFDNEYARLGTDLHAATYTVKMGGKFRLLGSSKWIGLDETNKDPKDILPQERTFNFRIDGLDLSRTVIQTDGVSNFENCLNLRTLYLKNCFFVDDWFVSKISHAFSDRLEILDISGCSSITDNGLILISHLRKLKKLDLNELENVANKEFISILLEEFNNDLQVNGSDHLSEETLKKVEHNFAYQQSLLKKDSN